MATSSTVFEVMIHRVDADADSAFLLQQQLRLDGIRAGVANLSVADEVISTRAARHSLYYIGEAFDEENLVGAPRSHFNSVFINPGLEVGVCDGEATSSYETLVNRISHGHQSILISAPELRRITQASYDAIAGQFTDVWFDSVPGEAIETFLGRLPLGGNILDAGCGPGHHARFFKKRGFYPVGLDFSRSMLEIAVAKNDYIPFEQGDILFHDLPPSHFDGVWSAVTLNHVPTEDVPLTLRNLVATLKWQGHIGLNFQIGRLSEIVNRDSDRRFFEYPSSITSICTQLEALGVCIVDTHIGTTTRNIHSLDMEMRFVTLVGRKQWPPDQSPQGQ